MPKLEDVFLDTEFLEADVFELLAAPVDKFKVNLLTINYRIYTSQSNNNYN